MSIRSLLGLQKYTGVERGDGEDFEAYKKRRSSENQATKRKLRGVVLWRGRSVFQRKCQHCNTVSTREMTCSNCGKNLQLIVRGQGPYSRQKHGEIGRKLVIQ